MRPPTDRNACVSPSVRPVRLECVLPVHGFPWVVPRAGVRPGRQVKRQRGSIKKTRTRT
jgi:hypothetical protein